MLDSKHYPNNPTECHHLDCEPEKIGYMYSGDRICNGCGMVFLNKQEQEEARQDANNRLGAPGRTTTEE